MGAVDIATKEFLSDSRNFADAVNLALYKGERVVDPASLRPLDADLAITIYGQGRRKPKAVERIRDLSRLAIAAMQDSHAAYIIVDMEGQTEIHYAMPVRGQLGDALRYDRQIQEIIAKHRENGELKSSAEFLSGLLPGDKLIPVITVVIYLGTKKWDAPLTLWDMLQTTDPRILQYVNNYRVNLLTAEMVPDLKSYHNSEFWRLMQAIAAASKGRKQFMETLQTRDYFKNMEGQTVRFMNTLLKTRIPVRDGEERVDVCQAVREINEMLDGYAEMQELLARKDAEMQDIITRKDAEILRLQRILGQQGIRL